METIIPLLIAAVVFGLQAYANFQKEQEKARKRNPGQRPPSAYPDMQHPSAPVPPYGDEKPVGHPDSRREVSPPQHDEWYPSDQPQSVPPAFEKYTGTVHAGRAKPTKRIQRQTPDRLRIAEEEEISGSGVSGYDFDLRDAVIKAAILERPYK